MPTKEQLQQRPRKPIGFQDISANQPVGPKHESTTRVGSSEVSGLHFPRLLFDISAKHRRGDGRRDPDRNGAASTSGSSSVAGESGPPQPPTGEKREQGERPDPRRNFEEARAMAVRGIKEARDDSLDFYGEDLTNADLINIHIETGKALYILERLENPDVSVNFQEIAQVSITPKEMARFVESAALDAEIGDVLSDETRMMIQEPRQQYRDPLRDIPEVIAGALESYSRDEELVRLELEEQGHIREEAQHLVDFFGKGQQTKTIPQIYGDDILYHSVVRAAYGEDIERFIHEHGRIMQLNAQIVANRQLEQFGENVPADLRDDVMLRNSMDVARRIQIRASRIWER